MPYWEVHFLLNHVYGCVPAWRQNPTESVVYSLKLQWLRLPDTYEAKIAKIGNIWTFWPVVQLIHVYHLFKIQKRAFLPKLLRWKKCSDILNCTFSIYGTLGKMAFRPILKRWFIIAYCIFSLFLPHKYQVSLNRVIGCHMEKQESNLYMQIQLSTF